MEVARCAAFLRRCTAVSGGSSGSAGFRTTSPATKRSRLISAFRAASRRAYARVFRPLFPGTASTRFSACRPSYVSRFPT